MPYPGEHNAWHEEFLAALRRVPVVQFACDAVGIQRSTAYRARQASKEFAEAWDDAMESGVDRAEREAYRRAVEGFDEPVIDRGELAYLMEPILDEEGQIQRDAKGHVRYRPARGANGELVPLTVRKHSDMLLAKVLSARRASYRTQATELTSPDGSMSPVDAGTRDARIAQLLEAARRRREAAGDDFSDLA